MHISNTFYGFGDVAESIRRRLTALQTTQHVYRSPVEGVTIVDAITGSGIFAERTLCLTVPVDSELNNVQRHDRQIKLFDEVAVGFVVLTPPTVFRGNGCTISPPSYVRTPHCGIMKSLAGRGIIPEIYADLLNKGAFFVTSGRQTPAAERVWHKLAHRFQLDTVDVRYGVPTDTDEPGQWLYTLHDPVRHTVKSLLQPDFSTTRNAGFL